MANRSREIEFLLLAIFVVLPMYGEAGVSALALGLFQGVAAVTLAFYVVAGREPNPPARLMQWAAIAYLVFFPVDLFRPGGSLIHASTHLLLFICIWQALDRENRSRLTQRLLVLALLFVASMATSTSVWMVPFSAVFFLLLYRQMIQLGRDETLSSLGKSSHSAGFRRAAGIYVVPAAVVALLLFPMLPRLKGSIVRGIVPGLSNATTGLSASIDFSEMRNISPDQTAVSRVSMPREAVPFFTPIRLRGEVYDRWRGGEWIASRGDWQTVDSNGAAVRVRRGSGIAPIATIEQPFRRDSRLYLPEQTYRIIGIPRLTGMPDGDIYRIPGEGAQTLEFKVQMAWRVEPLTRVPQPELIDYPISPEVAELSRRIAGSEQSTAARAEAISRFLLSEFTYVPNPADLGRPLSVDEFLLDERRGHCEYFAAGMVVLLRAQGIPARIVGGFYGGKLNPLTGQWVLSLSDAHAWVEVWDAGVWKTFDPTPPDLRPGTASDGLLRAYLSAISDSVTYLWDRYVLTFGLQDQVELLVNALGAFRQSISALRVAVRAALAQPQYLIAGAMILLTLIVLPGMLRRRRPSSIGERFAAVVERTGADAEAAMTSREMLARLEGVRPDLVPIAEEIVNAGERELFSPRGLSRGDRRAVLKRLREMRAMV